MARDREPIPHDLTTVRMTRDRVIILYLGRAIESGSAQEVFKNLQNPFTQALLPTHLPADPMARRSCHVLKGEMPNSIDLPTVCVFTSRCPVAISDCAHSRPSLDSVRGDDHRAASIRLVDGGNRIGQIL
jgi:oligopeptide/dipeptide ABC transporter ATP-binding protein